MGHPETCVYVLRCRARIYVTDPLDDDDDDNATVSVFVLSVLHCSISHGAIAALRVWGWH